MQRKCAFSATYRLSVLLLLMSVMTSLARHGDGSEPVFPRFMREATRIIASSNREYYLVEQRKVVGIWRFGAAEMLASFAIKEGDFCATVTNDGLCLLVESDTHRLVGWNPFRRQTVLDIKLEEKGYSMSAVGDIVSVGTWDGSVIVLSLSQRRKLWTAKHDIGHVAVSVSPDQEIVASGGADGSVRLWQAKNGSLVRALEVHKSPIQDIEFNSSGRFILTAGRFDELAHVVDVGKNRVVRKYPCQGLARCVDFSPNEKLVCVGTGKLSKRAPRKNAGVVQVWAFDSGNVVYKEALHKTLVTSVAFTKDGRMLLTTGSNWLKAIRFGRELE